MPLQLHQQFDLRHSASHHKRDKYLFYQINYKLTMEDLKSNEHCNLKSISPRGTESLLSVGEEIVLDFTGSKMACIQKTVSTFNNKLPQRNNGFEKNALKIRRTKPQMLGNLTFREIAEKRKEMLKNSSVEHTENDVLSLTPTPASNTSFISDKRNEEKSLENVTTCINPHLLVGKTITLEQGGIRRIKFLSQDSNTSSNKKLLKLDALQLTPKIIVRKCKQGFFPTNQTQINCKDVSKINDCQKMSEHVGMYSDKNSDELCFQPRSKSLPHIHSIAHDHLSSNAEFEKNELTRKNSELPRQKFPNEKHAYNYNTSNLMDIQKEKEENVIKCTPLNSSHDNLTILSQVACGELKMNSELGSKEVTKNTCSVKEKDQDFQHNLKKSNYKYVSLDHSYQQKHQPSKGVHCNEHFGNPRPMRTKTYISKRVENISQPSSQMNKINVEEKPMFAWCTQYITHRTLVNTSDYSVAKKCKLPSNQEQRFYIGNKNIPKYLNSNDNSKSQLNHQKQDRPYKSSEVSKKTLNLLETSKESLSIRNLHAKEIFKSIMPPTSQLCCENEDRKDSLVETAEITVETFFSSKEKLCEMNDEVLILKEILVTKSPICNAVPNKDSDISKLKKSRKQNLFATDSQRSTLETCKTSLVRKMLTEIPVNKEKRSKLFHKSNGDHNVTKPCLEITNTSSQTTLENMTGNEKVQKVINIHNFPLQTVKSQPTSLFIKPEESHNHTRECKSVSTMENMTADSVLGEKPSYPIKKCFVVVERLNEPKTKPNDVKEKTEYKKDTNSITKNKEVCITSNQNNVEVPVSNMNGKIVKRSPEKTFSGNREIYSLLTDFTSLGCSIEPERKLRRRSANSSQKSVENIESLNDCVKELFTKEEDPISCNKVTKRNTEMQLKAYTSLNGARFIESNNKSQSKIITPLKQNHFHDKVEKSLDAAEVVFVHPALTKTTPNSVMNNSIPVLCNSETLVSNQNCITQDDVHDLQIDCNFFPPMQQNILKCDKLPSDHISSQTRKNGKSPEIVSCSQNISSRPKRLKQLEEKNILVSRNLSKEKAGNRELKRTCVSLNFGTVKRKTLDFSKSDIEKVQVKRKVKIKPKNVNTKSNKHTLEKCSSIVNLVKLPSNSGQKNSVARNRLKKKPSVSNLKMKKVISNFSDHTDSENLQTSKPIQELNENFEESIQPNNQRLPKKISCDKINELKNGNSLSAKAKQLQLSRQIRQHSQTLSRSCVLKSKPKCLDSTNVALHIQTNNLTYAKGHVVDHDLLLADSSKPSFEFPNLTNCLVSSLDTVIKQSVRVRRRPSLNSQTLKNKYSKLCTEENTCILSKSKLSNNRKFYQKVTKAQDISNNQIYCSDLSETNSTTACVQKQEFSDSNEHLNHSAISCATLNKPTLNLPTPLKTCITNNLQPKTECSRNKSFGNNLSTVSSINIQPTDSHTCIDRQDNKLTTKVKCSSSTSDSRQEKVEPTNNQISHPSTGRDKIRLLIIEQLKRSRRGCKIALEKAPPKR